MKSCTDLEQSKKLIELGIDVNTSDMCHRYRWSNNSFINLPCAEKAREPITGDIPAWSLTALFKMLPHSARLERGSSTELYHVTLPNELKTSDCYIEPIDAVFEIIVWLKENKKL